MTQVDNQGPRVSVNDDIFNIMPSSTSTKRPWKLTELGKKSKKSKPADSTSLTVPSRSQEVKNTYERRHKDIEESDEESEDEEGISIEELKKTEEWKWYENIHKKIENTD